MIHSPKPFALNEKVVGKMVCECFFCSWEVATIKIPQNLGDEQLISLDKYHKFGLVLACGTQMR